MTGQAIEGLLEFELKQYDDANSFFGTMAGSLTPTADQEREAIDVGVKIHGEFYGENSEAFLAGSAKFENELSFAASEVEEKEIRSPMPLIQEDPMPFTEQFGAIVAVRNP